jgi:lipoic acid synthetase
MSNLQQNPGKPARLPAWLRRPLPRGGNFLDTRSLLADLRLSTVCQGAKCPNMHECFSRHTATFLILGSSCTRNCAFCNIAPGNPGEPDRDEPERVAKAAAALGLRYVVVTSVTRDDLPDGGAEHFAATIRAIRSALPASDIEVLIPDFQGSPEALRTVMREQPRVINHNVETHPDLYPRIRPQADYERSLRLLRTVAGNGIVAKSGFMAGLGESDEQVRELLRDLRDAGCSVVTIGQYMRPSKAHIPVERYVEPKSFEAYAAWGREMGIAHVFSAPLVRSSYQAEEALNRFG